MISVKFPEGFLKNMPEKLHKQLKEYANNFKTTAAVKNQDVTQQRFGDEIYMNIGGVLYPGVRQLSKSVLEVDVTGVSLSDSIPDIQTSLRKLAILENKAEELDKLKASLGTLKGVIGELK